MLPPTVSLVWAPELRAAPWALNGLHLAMSSSKETHLLLWDNSIKLCVCSSAWWPCWLQACIVEEVRWRGGKNRRKTRQKRKQKKGETFKRRMHSVVGLVCGVSAEYTCAVLLPAVWVTDYCDFFFFRTSDMTCVFLKAWNLVVRLCVAH